MRHILSVTWIFMTLLCALGGSTGITVDKGYYVSDWVLVGPGETTFFYHNFAVMPSQVDGEVAKGVDKNMPTGCLPYHEWPGVHITQVDDKLIAVQNMSENTLFIRVTAHK